MDCSLPVSVHGILQARILEWVAISSSRGSSWLRDWTCVSYIYLHWQVGSLLLVPSGKPNICRVWCIIPCIPLPPQQQPCGLRLLWSPCYRWRNRGTEGLGNLSKITPFAGKASLAGEKAAGPQSLHSSPKFLLGELPLCLILGATREHPLP